MNALLFLGVAVAVSVIGSLIVLVRNRSPRSIDHGIDDFAQRMQALSPDQAPSSDQGPENIAHDQAAGSDSPIEQDRG